MAGSSVWITEGQHARLRCRADRRTAGRRGGGPRVGEEIAELLRRYIDRMAQSSPPDRGCCVATLLPLPGVLVSARRGPGGKRVDEVAHARQ